MMISIRRLHHSVLAHCLMLGLFFGIVTSVYAVKIEFHDFKNKQQEQLYLQLIAELRCVVCQNQNLAESNADLAKDMRDKTYQMVIDGKSRDDVIKFMTDRYGQFVLYNPPFEIKTLLLWLGPLVLLLLSLYLLFRRIRSQQHSSDNDTLSDEQRNSVRNLLKNKS